MKRFKDFEWDIDEEEENKFKIGDKVEFIKKYNIIPPFYSDNDGIPKNLIQHGSFSLHRYYNATIINIYNEYYIIKFKNIYNKYIQLGFKEESFDHK